MAFVIEDPEKLLQFRPKRFDLFKSLRRLMSRTRTPSRKGKGEPARRSGDAPSGPTPDKQIAYGRTAGGTDKLDDNDIET